MEFKFEKAKSLVNLSNSILKRFGVEPFHDSIPEIDEILSKHKKIAVLLFDGLGEHVIDYYLPITKYLKDNSFMSVKSTYPPTTTAATTALLTGKYPIESGWLGWSLYFKDLQRRIDIFLNQDSETFDLIPHKSHYLLNDYIDTKEMFELIKTRNSSIDVFDIRRYPIQEDGPTCCASLENAITTKLQSSKECLMYAYWDEPDSSLHRFGFKDPKVKYQIKRIIKTIIRVVKENKDTLFIVLADHGHKEIKTIPMFEHNDLCETFLYPPALEARATTFYIKENKKEEFVSLFNRYYKSKGFQLYSKEEAIQNNIFGLTGKNSKGLEYLGDYVSVATSEYSFEITKKYQDLTRFISHHGGYTPDEMDVNVSLFNIPKNNSVK